MSKFIGRTHRKQDERAKKKVSAVGASVAAIAGQTQKFINEWSDKFNSLSKQVEALFKLATTELGNVWSNQQRIVGSIDHIDINVLAIAELNKDIYARLMNLEARMKTLETMAETPELTDAERATVVTAGEDAYREAVKQAFSLVLERRKKDDEERKAAREKAEAEAKAADDAKKEAERAERALAEAEKDVVTDATSGGPGCDIPEGAQVFGGA